MEKEIDKDIEKRNDGVKEKRRHGAFFWMIITGIVAMLAGSCMACFAGLWDYGLYDSPRLFADNWNDRLLRSYAVYALSDFQDDFNLAQLEDTNFQYAVYMSDDPQSVDITDRRSFLVCTIPDDVLKTEADKMFSYSATLGPNSGFFYNIDSIWNSHGYIISNHLSGNEDTCEKEEISDVIYIWNTDKAYVISGEYYYPVTVYFENSEGERPYDARNMVNLTRDGWTPESEEEYHVLIDSDQGEVLYLDMSDVSVGRSETLSGLKSSDELQEWGIDFSTWTVWKYTYENSGHDAEGENYYLIARCASPINDEVDDLFSRSAPLVDLAISLRYLPIVFAGIFSILTLICFVIFMIRFIEWFGKTWKKISWQWRENVGLFWRLIGLCFIYGFVELILAMLCVGVGECEIALVFWGLTVLMTMVFFVIVVLQINKIALGARRIANGDLSRPIDTNYMFFDLKTIGQCINSTQFGLERAVEDRMKSERFKTELISNVSHDIKTPLTSIISYVELLKQQPGDAPADPEYLEALERQSVKLKKLLEDLIEASKAQTGNLKAELEICNVNMVLHQVIGEYEEKLSAKQIELRIKTPEEPVNIMADSRHLQRVLDNLFVNISKYAQPGTRAYLNLTAGTDDAVIELKNTSSEPLNMTSDELLERFARGDSSRGSEGNGLGLSIAQSLTELMNGKLRLVVDGDLFKVILIFPRVADAEAAGVPGSAQQQVAL